MKELQELLRLMKSETSPKLWDYGTILEYVQDRIKELRRIQREQQKPATEKRARNKQPHVCTVCQTPNVTDGVFHKCRPYGD